MNELEKLKRENERLKSLVELADQLIPPKGGWWRKWLKAKKDLGFENVVSIHRNSNRSSTDVDHLSSHQAIS